MTGPLFDLPRDETNVVTDTDIKNSTDTDIKNSTDEMETVSTDTEKPVKIAQATELVNLALSTYRLGCSEEGRPFAVQIDGPAVAQLLRGGRGSLRTELSKSYFAEHGRAPASAALADAMLVLQGRALECEREPLALRVGPFGDGVVLDLGSADGAAVVVQPGRWEVVDRSPVLFRRTELTGALPRPLHGGDLDLLRRHLNVTDEAWPVVVGFLVAALLPRLPHPVAFLTGEQGTGKTTAGQRLAQLLDPSPAQVRSAPRDVETWVLSAAGSWVVALDNLSSMPDWLSDALCRAVTGDGLPRRALYTDDELTVTAFRRVVILTSIDLGSLKGDLAERLVTFELARIEPGSRRLDEDLANGFDVDHAAILGGLLDLVAQVLAVLPTVLLDRLPRMADFARVLAAVDTVTGWSSLETYGDLGERLAEEVVEGDAVATAVAELARNRGEWKGTATELRDVLTPDKPAKGWPSTPRAMGGAVRRAATALRGIGIEVDFEREDGTGRRTICLRGPEKAGKGPSLPSQRSRTPPDQDERRDGGRDGSDGRDPTVTPTVTVGQAADQDGRLHRDGRDGRDGGIRATSVPISEAEEERYREAWPELFEVPDAS